MKTIAIIVDNLPASCENCRYMFEYHGELVCPLINRLDGHDYTNVNDYVEWHHDIDWKPERHPDCPLLKAKL